MTFPAVACKVLQPVKSNKTQITKILCSPTDGCNWFRKDSDGVPRSSVTLFHWSISDEVVKEL